MRVARAGRGFTLLEVLVATALLSLVMLGLITAMRSFAQTEARIDERIRGDEDLRVSDRFLRAVVASISPRLRTAAAGAPKEIDFTGRADAMRWVGVMPARHGAGGLYRFHLFVRPPNGEVPAALVLEFAPYVPRSEGPLDPASVQSRALAIGIDGATLRYQDELAAGEQWFADWPYADRLPRRIGISLAGVTQPWPELLVGVIAVTGPSVAARGGGLAAGTAVGPF
jgi:general secretion pathway protein J